MPNSTNDCCLSCGAQVLFAHPIGKFNYPQSPWDHVQNRQIGNDAMNNALSIQR